MTERMSHKYFGGEKPIGESITLSMLGQKKNLESDWYSKEHSPEFPYPKGIICTD